MRNETTTIQAKAPAIRLDRFPRVQCGFYPTPLEEMRRLRQRIGKHCPRLFIKRDDFTGTGFGSNKLRKLDYAIAREIERGTETIVTIAGEKSNHARVTAAVCARLGLRCELVLNRAADGTIPNGFQCASRIVYEMLGANVHWVLSREEREPTALELVGRLKKIGQRAAYIPLGVSFPIGALGFVQAIQEASEQFDRLGAPQPDYIFHASTSGGTQAGMVAGSRIFGIGGTKIIGVSPDDSAPEVASRVAEITNGVFELLETSLRVSEKQVTVLDSYIGDGYGTETIEASEAAKLLATTEGIILDPVYTAKAMSALLDWIEKGKLTERDTVLFWHTGGQLALFYAPVKQTN